jgi:hypothetical protein
MEPSQPYKQNTQQSPGFGRSIAPHIEKLTGIGRHGHRFFGGAMRTGDDGFKDHGSS